MYWKQRRMMFFDAFSFAFPAALQRIPYSLFVSLIWTVVTYFPVGLSAEPSRCALVLCYATLCCAVLCVLCCAVLCCAVLCMLCCAVLCCAVLCCAVLCMLCCALLSCACCAALCCLLHAVLLCAVLRCNVPCYSMSNCIRLDTLKMQIATFQPPTVYITCDFL